MRHLDVSRQKLTPHCLATIFDSQLPSPKLSPKMPPKLSLAHKRGHFVLFQNIPAVRVIARQLRDKNCLAAIFVPRHQDVSSGPLGTGRIRVRRVQFETPSPVISLALTEFWGERMNSVSSSQPVLCAITNSPSLPQNSVSSLCRSSTLETVFRPFS